MSTRWSAGNPFLITPVSNVFDLPDQSFYRVWISIHFALALRTRIECFALVPIGNDFPIGIGEGIFLSNTGLDYREKAPFLLL